MKKILLILLSFTMLTVSIIRAQQQNLKKDTVLYLMGYAHLDTEWRWDYQYTIDTCLRNTLYDNFKLIEKYPHYIFNFSGANRYRMIKEYYPSEYERMKGYIAAGRWFPCGSSVEENDVLSPSPESVIRQVLYGNRFFKREFGVTSSEYMLPDCFGFPAHLPTTLAHCGLKGFSTQKLSWGSAKGIPFNVGRWIGPDGQGVLVSFNPGSYDSGIKGDLSTDQTWIDRIIDQGNKTGLYADYHYYGTGDMGGAPDEESVKWIEKSISNNRGLKIVSSRASQIFEDITPEMASKLPIYQGELLLTNHSAGSINSHAYMKRWNRKNEILAYNAEVASAAAMWAQAQEYPAERINEAWRLVLGAQFHDILPGTSIPKSYEYAWNDERIAMSIFAGILTSSSAAIINSMNTQTNRIPLIVFNSLPVEREDVAEAWIVLHGKIPPNIKVFNPDGHEVPSQLLDIDGEKLHIIFLARVLPVSWSVFNVRPSETGYENFSGLKITENSLENSRYIIKINENGDIGSMYDKLIKKELLTAPARLAFQYERPEHWPAWNMDWNNQKKPPSGYVDGQPVIRIAENGPVRIALEIAREARGSKFNQQIRLSCGKSSERIEFDTRIDWRTKETALKAVFPLTTSNSFASYNTGIGVVERSNNDSLKFEVPSYQWFDLTDKSGNSGVSVLEDCKYGSDKPDDNTVRLTLLYTPGVRKSYKDQATLDYGKHHFLYGLYSHSGDWKEGGSHWQAMRLNQPLEVFQAKPHQGKMGKIFSFMSVSSSDIGIMSLKKAEDNDEIIVRVNELTGKQQKGVIISFCSPVTSIREMNAQEYEIATIAPVAGNLVFNISPFQPRTFAVKLKEAAFEPVKPSFRTIDIACDMDVVSSDTSMSDISPDAIGKSYPAELWPVKTTIDGIPFVLGNTADRANNAMRCNGQEIILPAGDFDRLYILAAARHDSTKAILKAGSIEYPITFSNCEGYYGQWDKRIWNGEIKPIDFVWDNITYAGLEPGYTRPDEIAFFSTHTHLSSGKNDSYQYRYVYKYKIDLPRETGQIILPDNPDIMIFAMTAAYGAYDNVFPAVNLTDTVKYRKEDYLSFSLSKPVKIAPAVNWIEPGKYVEITLSCEDKDAEIRYTLDGTEPVATSAKYLSPLRIDKTCTLKCKSFKTGLLTSELSECHYQQMMSFEK